MLNGEEVKLGIWVNSRRRAYKSDGLRGDLSPERCEVLGALPGWAWNVFERDFQLGLGALRQFVEREGTIRVPSRHVETFGGEAVRLAAWNSNRHMAYRNGQLSEERIEALEALPGWVWLVR